MAAIDLSGRVLLSQRSRGWPKVGSTVTVRRPQGMNSESLSAGNCLTASKSDLVARTDC